MRPPVIFVTLALIASAAHAEWELILDDGTYSIASDGERLYASTDRGLRISLDDGVIWRASNFQHPVELLTASPDAVYGFNHEDGLMRSVTKGNTWRPKNNGLKVRWWENGKWETRIPRIQQILVTSSGMVIAVGYHQGTWISRDRGDSWHEEGLEWEDLSRGLPDDPALSSLVVHRDRIFAASWTYGVFMFDHHSEVWHHAGLSRASGLVSHRGHLYTASKGHIYRTDGPFVSPEGKTAVTWGAIKLGNTR